MNRINLLATGAAVALVIATGASMAQQEPNSRPPAEKMAPPGAKTPSAVKHQNGEAQNAPAGRSEKLDGRAGETPQNHGRPETAGQAPREDHSNQPAEYTPEPKRGEAVQRPGSGQNGHPSAAAPREDRDENRASVGQGAAGARANINLTADKRTRIHETIIHERNAPRVGSVNFDVSVGARVPRSVRFVALPQTIVEIEPAWRGFEYFMIGNEIVIVDPRSLEIVAVVDA